MPLGFFASDFRDFFVKIRDFSRFFTFFAKFSAINAYFDGHLADLLKYLCDFR